jgi:hypothetical protein
MTLTVGVSWQRPICRKQEAEGEGGKLVARCHDLRVQLHAKRRGRSIELWGPKIIGILVEGMGSWNGKCTLGSNTSR